MLKHAVTVAVALSAAAFAESKLKVQPFTASGPGFLVNATLVTGEKEAVLIDSAFTRSDAHRLVAAVLDSGKNLTTLYVTHGHPDHYFGAEVVKAAFPKVKVVALPETIAVIKKTWQGKVKQWGPLYGANLTDKPVIPEPLKGKTLTVDGETLEVSGPVQGDDEGNSYVWIPGSKTLITGDVVFNGTYVWTAETRTAQRTAWIATLDKLEALQPTMVVAGHQRPDAKPDAASIAFTKAYLGTFEEAVTASKSSDEVQSKVKAKYPDLALEPILKFGADAQFTAPAKPKG
jgi:glyoxylase-like metal-dependent hydrolase (beta-lactamase superfamily II)